MERLGPEIKAAIKAYWAPGLFFEELDLAYVGVIDGHDVGALRAALTEAFDANRPVVVHIHTVKGKGFQPAEEGGLEGMEKWHAAKPGSIVDGAPAPKKDKQVAVGPKTVPVSESDSPEGIEKLEKPPPPAPPQYTAVFAEALVEEAKRDKRVIGITAAMAGGTGLDKLLKELPDQYYDPGIAEQEAVLFASGLAIQGAKPVCAIYSTFLQRAFDQIVHDVCLQKLNVVFAMDRAGLVGDDGPTHHGAFDVSYFRQLPNVVVMAPRDEAQLVHMLRTALAYDDGPIAFRYPRGAAEGAPMPDAPKEIEIGKGELLLPGDGQVALLGYGYGVQVALRAAEILREQGPGAHRRRRPLRQAARRRADREARRRARAARDDRGERAAGRLRLRRAGAPRGRLRRTRGRPRDASFASAFPTATSPTASRRCSARRSASRARRSPSASSPPSARARQSRAEPDEGGCGDRGGTGAVRRALGLRREGGEPRLRSRDRAGTRSPCRRCPRLPRSRSGSSLPSSSPASPRRRRSIRTFVVAEEAWTVDCKDPEGDLVTCAVSAGLCSGSVVITPVKVPAGESAEGYVPRGNGSSIRCRAPAKGPGAR